MTISCALNGTASGTVNFKNPLKDNIKVTVDLVEIGKGGTFQLLQKRPNVTISGLGTIQIPFSFSPIVIGETVAKVIVTLSHQMKWTYPLVGVTETSSDKIDFSYSTKSRNKVTEQISVHLPGLDFPQGSEEEFQWKIQVTDEKESILMRSVSLQPIVTKLKAPSDPLVFRLEFMPLKPFKNTAELLIDKASGGRWKFIFEFEATEPDIDDTIVIESPLQKTSSVAFRLPNTSPTYSDFEAFFAAGSDPSFSVNPKEGVLEPMGREGTQLVVSFRPSE